MKKKKKSCPVENTRHITKSDEKNKKKNEGMGKDPKEEEDEKKNRKKCYSIQYFHIR